MDATKPYEFIWFGGIHGPKPYKFIGFRWAQPCPSVSGLAWVAGCRSSGRPGPPRPAALGPAGAAGWRAGRGRRLEGSSGRLGPAGVDPKTSPGKGHAATRATRHQRDPEVVFGPSGWRGCRLDPARTPPDPPKSTGNDRNWRPRTPPEQPNGRTAN